jgi:glycerophosphoryl diester phosphodiesterase
VLNSKSKRPSAWSLCLATAALLICIWSLPTLSERVAAGAFDLSAHRGGRGLYPENTLVAFSNALAMGVTSMEMDAAVTRDGVVVVSHDQVLNRDITRGPKGGWIGDERKVIKTLTFKELQRYDVGRIMPGTDYAAEFSRQKAVDGTRIPSLSSVLRLVRGVRSDVVIRLEIKYDPTDASLPTLEREPLTRALIDVLRAEGFTKQAYILCFDWDILQIAQRLAPEIPAVYLTSGYLQDDTLGIGKAERSKWTGGFNVNDYGGSVPKAIKAAGGKFWSPDSRDLDRVQVKEALEAGIGVTVWTVNDPAEMARIIDMGVDGIITDYPDILRQVLIGKGRSVPTPVPTGALCKTTAKFARAVCAR